MTKATTMPRPLEGDDMVQTRDDAAFEVQDVGEDAPSVEVDPAFAVRDAATANWVVRKVAEARRYAASAEAWAAAEVSRADREERFFLTRFGPDLEAWVRSELSRLGGRRRSLDLPAGRAGFRAVPPALVVTDETLLLPWCRGHLPAALRLRVDARGKAALLLGRLLAGSGHLDLDLTESASVAEVRRHLEGTGELPPGTDVGSPVERFYVR